MADDAARLLSDDDLGSTSGEQFAEDCRAAQPSQPTSIACELAYLSRKPVGELEQALLRTRVFVSLLRCTITAVTLRLDQFAEAGSESGSSAVMACLPARIEATAALNVRASRLNSCASRA
jgi:hypothetical protein